VEVGVEVLHVEEMDNLEVLVEVETHVEVTQVVQVMQEVILLLKDLQEVEVILMQTKTITEEVVAVEPLRLEVMEQVQATQVQELLEMVVMALM